MNPVPPGILERLNAGEILVGDGALGSLLLARGLPPGECPEAWNLSRPEVIEEIAGHYRDAGADIIETNSFGASPLKLARYGLAARTEEINRRAVEIARTAAGGRAYVSGSCGPSARILRPYGDADPQEIFESFERQFRALIAAGVDALCIETMTDLAEAMLAVKAAKSVSPSITVMATMTFDQTRRGYFTIMGNDIPSAAAGLTDAGADIIGSNCGSGSERMVEIAREFLRATKHPVLIQSNAGMPEIVADQAVYSETPDLMAKRALEMIEAGVSIVGGCCGTTPEHVRAVRRVVDERSADRRSKR